MQNKNNGLDKNVIYVTADGKRLSAILDDCDNCGKSLTAEELAKVDQVLRPHEYKELIVMECAHCTENRRCPDDEYFTDLGAIADAFMERYFGGKLMN
jgi:hypothetical protein